MDQPTDPAKEKKYNKTPPQKKTQKNTKKTEKKLGGGGVGGSIFANPPSENPLVDEPS